MYIKKNERLSKKIRPKRIRLEASSICQLKCPICPNTLGQTLPIIGKGFLKFSNFQKLLNDNPWIEVVELSNYGEIFLNPELLKIIKHAYKREVILTAATGVNLNNVNEDVLEGLVKYNFRSIGCSIDGASSETYKKYRVRGNYGVVIENIKKINSFKKQYKSRYPVLTWHFIIFGHNEHELPIARKLADELDMHFNFKTSWNPNFSPIRNRNFIKEEVGYVSWVEWRIRYGIHYMREMCHQMWNQPQINWDGKILGCCCNIMEDFGGNAFTDGLFESLNSERITYAREMLLGTQGERSDIPCTTCSTYISRKKNRKWIK
jgi:MoaA/NifB/PqqE/SkfB family radical SAM enzyme